MPIVRRFFDWSQPALPQVVDALCSQYRRGRLVDLSPVLLVVPGRRVGRRFLELLTERTRGRHEPPVVVTPEQLPEELYEPQRPLAGELTQRLAWGEALRSLSEEALRPLLRSVPPSDDLPRWLELGTLLARHHTELAADGLDFQKVRELGKHLPGFQEQSRWVALQQAQEKYLALLDDLGLWDQQTARLVAIEQHECHTDQEIILLGAVDLPRTHRRMLDQVEDRVTAFIHAPEELADHFDEHGCLLPERWRDCRLDLSAEQIRVVGGPADQAAEAAYAVAELDGRYRADEITIGLGDESLTPHLQRQFEACGLRTRPVKEKELLQTPPALLLAAVADLLEHDRIEHFTALARHPDVAAWLEAQGCSHGWLEELDDYVTHHLQPRLGEWLGPPAAVQRLRPAYERVRAWLAPLQSPPQRPLSAWSAPIAELLLELYRHVQFDVDVPSHRVVVDACRKLHTAVEEHARIPAPLGGTFTAAEAIRLALDAVSGEMLPPPPQPEAIPLLGWLELPLDDAPVAIVTTFNEDHIPQSLNSDLFLPNSLRARLGLLDNARRYARDAYALSVLLHARQRVTLIVGRRTAEGDPLRPSRLLFAAEPEVIAQRIVQFYGDAAETRPPVRPPLPAELTTKRATPGFRIPRPRPLAEPPTELNVTEFKSYLACPYRYYLSYVLGLGSADDAAEELGGSDFGELLHEVLKAFGLSPLNSSPEADEIQSFLEDQLESVARRRLGRQRRPVVELQLEQLRQRLRAFARVQAELADWGWEIRFVEHSGQQTDSLFDLGDGRTIHLRGRIDRIDYHREHGWRILDYKSSSQGETPEQVHRQGGEWIDLQLPLYRHLARPLGVEEPVQLGYLLLPEDSSRTRVALAEWTEEELREADELAREVARRILDQTFWPPAEMGSGYDDWDLICQVNAFDGEVVTENSP